MVRHDGKTKHRGSRKKLGNAFSFKVRLSYVRSHDAWGRRLSPGSGRFWADCVRSVRADAWLAELSGLRHRWAALAALPSSSRASHSSAGAGEKGEVEQQSTNTSLLHFRRLFRYLYFT